jgi:hypothetical protein
MSVLNISDEAVEAAAAALREHNPFLPDLQAMGDAPADEFDCCARAALEAAAPHLMAAAWDEGQGAGWNDCLLDLQNGGAKSSRNPYRATGAVTVRLAHIEGTVPFAYVAAEEES